MKPNNKVIKTRFLVVSCKIKAQSYNLLLPIPPDAYRIDISNMFELWNEVESSQIALVSPFCIIVVVVVCVFFKMCRVTQKWPKMAV